MFALAVEGASWGVREELNPSDRAAGALSYCLQWVATPPSLPPFWSSNSLSPPPPSPALTEAYRRASFTRLGYLRLSSNEASKHRARELKSVNFPEFIDTLFIKLLLLSPHSLPELNPGQQVVSWYFIKNIVASYPLRGITQLLWHFPCERFKWCPSGMPGRKEQKG